MGVYVATAAPVSFNATAPLAMNATGPLAMDVTVTNQVGKTIQIRAVDPNTHVYGVTLCGGAPLENGQSCSGIAQDWIAVATDGSYDAGDPFDVWWGDGSYVTAHA